VVLNIVDALICQYEGEERSLLHYSKVLNEIRVSRDPVALDVLSLQELERQRQVASAPEIKSRLDLFKNAALLELGVSDLKKSRSRTLPSSPNHSRDESDQRNPISFTAPGPDKSAPHSSTPGRGPGSRRRWWDKNTAMAATKWVRRDWWRIALCIVRQPGLRS
jgi:hypothetical protein